MLEISVHNKLQTLILNQFESHKTVLNKTGRVIKYAALKNISTSDIEQIASTSDSDMLLSGFSKRGRKSFFSCVIELLQNLKIHGTFTQLNFDQQFCFVSKSDDTYRLDTFNFIATEAVRPLSNKLNKYLNSNYDELKAQYLNILSEGKISKKGGAGLGLITLCLKSNFNLTYKIETINEHMSFLMFSVQVPSNL